MAIYNGRIYKIVNSANATIYIGSTKQILSARMGAHRQDAGPKNKGDKFHTAMRLIGIDRFTIILIKLFNCTCKEELVAEEYRITDLEIAAGVEVYNENIGGHHSDESKAKIGAANTGKIVTMETKAKMSAAQKGKILTASTKAKIGAANLGKIATAETKAKMSAALFKFGCISVNLKAKSSKWIFICTINSVQSTKNFAIKKYGYHQAKFLAEAARKAQYPAWQNDEDIALAELGAIEL